MSKGSWPEIIHSYISDRWRSEIIFLEVCSREDSFPLPLFQKGGDNPFCRQNDVGSQIIPKKSRQFQDCCKESEP